MPKCFLVLAWFESYVPCLVFLDSSLELPGQEKQPLADPIVDLRQQLVDHEADKGK